MTCLILALSLVIAVAPGQNVDESDREKPANIETAAEGKPSTIELWSSAFENDSLIPGKYTCDGKNVSPALSWSGVPEGAISLALICDDPDAPMGTWVHWILYGIPPGLDSLPEGVPARDTVLQGMRQGMTSFRSVGYRGPCPPEGGPHRYYFKLYALDTPVDMGSGKTKEDLLAVMEEHIIAQGQLMGRYQR
jgi:Raf kinase inhibitor-like YbhB/YbcL family protein